MLHEQLDGQLRLAQLDPLQGRHFTVRKRDGRVVPFEESRILLAIEAAFKADAGLAAAQALPADAQAAALRITSEVVQAVVSRAARGEALGIESIQDLVEAHLMEAGQHQVAKGYILFREERRKARLARDVGEPLVPTVSSIAEYLSAADWRVNANANQGYSLGGLILNVAGKVTANYWLHHVYGGEIERAHREGDFHIHDLDMLAGYCAGWSLRQLLWEGFNGVPNKVEAAPAKHLRTALGQMVNFLGTLQNEWAGAQAFSSVDTYLAPFVRKDGLSHEEIRQCLQEFIYNLNVPSRWGTQTPFTNLTFDWTCPADLRGQQPIIGGEEMPFCYGELQAEMDLINRAFIEVMTAGDTKGRLFTFPIPTYNITNDFDWDHPNTEPLFEMTAKYGLPYFQNFINSELQPGMVRSMCCRLQLDLRELLKRGNGLFGSAEQTGSVGVVTINCARLGYKYKQDETRLFVELDRLLELAKQSLEMKRRVIEERMQAGLYPYTRRYLGTLRNHFSTIGVNGVNECVRNLTSDRENISTPAGVELGLRLLDHVRARIVAFQQETGHLFNLEATPAEGTTYRFAREDRKRFPDMLQAGTPDAPYYTNSSQLPVGATDDPFAAMTHQEPFQRLYTGGTVFHLYMGERISSARACKQLVRRALTRFRIPYITVTPTFSICPQHGYLTGEHEFCPRCETHRQPCEIWTRVMGYYRPYSQFNRGKQSEFSERTFFVEPANASAEAEFAIAK
ncbi:MAG TPA: ribonucleoside triphosphate reductase [Candidatus Paceibacterota bacterium]|nr:ribonucleoside triphosphate reductase [Verrucomicrobiota bacterium]HSA09094.1 ribonucleoside triphosphate reductase [Candidatus Paceibacterota bacterium]